MSEGLPPQPPQGPTPAPQPQGQPTPPPESFQAKVNRLINQIMPPADPANDTPEARIQRTLYLLVAIGIAIFLLCGFLYLVGSIFM
jgi:hypothetical protein